MMYRCGLVYHYESQANFSLSQERLPTQLGGINIYAITVHCVVKLGQELPKAILLLIHKVNHEHAQLGSAQLVHSL